MKKYQQEENEEKRAKNKEISMTKINLQINQVQKSNNYIINIIQIKVFIAVKTVIKI